MYLYSILNIFYNSVHQFVILIYGIITYYCLFAAIVPWSHVLKKYTYVYIYIYIHTGQISSRTSGQLVTSPLKCTKLTSRLLLETINAKRVWLAQQNKTQYH